MDDFDKINKLFKKIVSVSNNILHKSYPIFRDLLKNNNDMVDEFLSEMPESNNEEALTYLQEAANCVVQDAKKIIDEIDLFISNWLIGTDVLLENENDYPFLISVWQGDLYDAQEREALEELLDDLTNQYENVNRYYIVKKALDDY